MCKKNSYGKTFPVYLVFMLFPTKIFNLAEATEDLFYFRQTPDPK